MKYQRRHYWISAVPSGSRAFTLLELLVVIGIISVLSVATVVSVQKISRDVKISTGVNRLLGSLSAARAEAIRTNSPTLVTFRVVKDYDDPSQPEQVEVVVAKFTGEIRRAGYYGSGQIAYLERYIPVPTIAPRLLPEGIKVAAPYTDFSFLGDIAGDDADTLWNFMATGPMELKLITFSGDSAPTLTYDTNPGQWGGGFAVLFSGNGTIITRDPNTIVSAEQSSYRFVDFDSDGLFDVSKQTSGYGRNSLFFEQRQTDRDFIVNMSQFLVVFDEDRAKEDVDFSNWPYGNLFDMQEQRNKELGEWVNLNAARVHFNRYTGVAEVGQQ